MLGIFVLVIECEVGEGYFIVFWSFFFIFDLDWSLGRYLV